MSTGERKTLHTNGDATNIGRRHVSDEKINLLDRTGQSLEQDQELWPALVITKEEIDAEIARLADLPLPGNGRRQSLFVHPRATEPGIIAIFGMGLAGLVFVRRRRIVTG